MRVSTLRSRRRANEDGALIWNWNKQEQLDFLKEYGCAEAQGYYFHRPLSVDSFEKLLKEQS